MRATCFWRSLGLLVAAGLLSVSHSRADDTGLDSLDPDENIQVVYAVYGGIIYDKTLSHFENVTDKVSDLLKKSATGFPVAEKALTGKETNDWSKSLIVVYNYEQESHFCNIVEGDTVSLAKLKDWAKTNRKSKIGNAIPPPSGDDFHIDFAAYGCGDNFFNVTDLIKTFVHDQPDGFLPDIVNMGGDPHPSWDKVLVMIFDTPTGRYFYHIFLVGPKVTKAAILDAAKSN